MILDIHLYKDLYCSVLAPNIIWKCQFLRNKSRCTLSYPHLAKEFYYHVAISFRVKKITSKYICSIATIYNLHVLRKQKQGGWKLIFYGGGQVSINPKNNGDWHRPSLARADSSTPPQTSRIPPP